MQRILILCVLFTQMEIQYACNICSCTSMGNSIGILPKFRSHFIGVRETYRTFQSIHPATVLNPEPQINNEYYHNTELWGRWYPGKRLQVFGFIPYNSYRRIEPAGVKSLAGLGDVSVLANYILLNREDTGRSRIYHALLLGGGIKFGSGKFNTSENASFQLGSGSNSLLLNVSHTSRYKNSGMSCEAFYSYNGVNADKYHFGNRMNASVKGFYWIRSNSLSILPAAGFMHEKKAYDAKNRVIQDYTSGNSTLASFSADIYFKNMQISGSVLIPVHQNLADGQITEYKRLQVNLVYHINNKKTNK